MDEHEIVLGEQYRDTLSGIEGVATSQHLYLHGCTRVALQWTKDGEIKDHVFDSPQLERVAPLQQVTSARTGGDRPVPAPRAVG
jgi:hypothetical protein